MIYWLVSYPKSGNTWMRALLTSYGSDNAALDINALNGQPLTIDRELFDDWAGLSSADLTLSELLPLRARFHTEISQQAQPQIIKVHDAYARNSEGHSLFPAQITAGVLYLIRNPLDVALSFAHHDNTGIERIVDRLGDEGFALSAQVNRLYGHFPQNLGSWSHHVRSWVDVSGLRVKVVRYEDLSADPVGIFESVLSFLGRPVDDERLRASVQQCRFERLRAQELDAGFLEKQPTAPSFFREGRVGAWRHGLSSELTFRIIRRHRTTMLRFGYLDRHGRPTA